MIINIYLIMIFTKLTIMMRKKIIENLNKNKDVLKKLIKMYHLYLKNINNKKNKYNNIELIRYDCKKIKIIINLWVIILHLACF